MVSTINKYDLSKHNTFSMHVSCARYIEYTESQDIPEALALARELPCFKQIGAGSNLLFAGDYPGAIMHSAISGAKVMMDEPLLTLVRVGAGMKLDDLCRWAAEQRLWGLENLSGIPGEVGAAAVQNVGAYGAEAKDVVSAVHAYDTLRNQFATLRQADCNYAYRYSMLKDPKTNGRYIVHAVDFKLSRSKGPNLSYPSLANVLKDKETSELTPAQVREAIISVRDAKLPDPAIVPNAGSFFKNPEISKEEFQALCDRVPNMTVPHYDVENELVKVPAAWLIEHSGWKGKGMGRAAVWHLQPLVLVNPHGDATPKDIITLRDAIINSVRNHFGITLTPEVEEVKSEE